MKKVISILLILFGIMGYSKSVDTYESKKVFNGLMEVVLKGKNINDPKISKILNTSSLNEIFTFKLLDLGKDFQYTITDVKESDNKSELTLRVKYKTSNMTEENFLVLMTQVLEDMGIGLSNINDMDNFDEKKYLEILVKIKEKSKLDTHTDTLKIKMKKENGLWDLDEGADEDKLLEYMLAPYQSIINIAD